MFWAVLYRVKISDRYFMSRKLRTYALPVAMIAGVVAHDFADSIGFLTPYLLFLMLLVSYCKLDVRTMRLSPMYVWMFLGQMLLAWLAYGVLYRWDVVVAQGVFICLFCPTATSAPVVAAMLGGNLSLLVGYSLLCNVSVALLSPLFFSLIGVHAELSFWQSTLIICRQVLPLLLLPLLIAVVLGRFAPRIREYVRSHQNLSFYLWIVALFIVVGRSVNFVLQQPATYIFEEVAMSLLALLCCVVQFFLGRRIGNRYGDKIAGAQGMGQKNTVLAIWMALTYLHPVASIAPASYVIWQNIINLGQLAMKERRGA